MQLLVRKDRETATFSVGCVQETQTESKNDFSLGSSFCVQIRD